MIDNVSTLEELTEINNSRLYISSSLKGIINENRNDINISDVRFNGLCDSNVFTGKCENISYYSPESTTSGPYLTIPLNEHGIPAFYFEEYSFATQDEKNMHMLELIYAIDSLDIK